MGVVIPAGGKGNRFGGEVPKQFLKLGSRPVIAHSVAAFEACPSVREIVLVVPADQIRQTEAIVRRFKFSKISHIVVGGRERQHSVRNGLASFDKNPEIVLVHDAVRPLVSAEVIMRVIHAADKFGGAVAGVPVKDTVKIGQEGFYKKTLDRNSLWAVQTPQGFRYDILKRAHLAAQRNAFVGTDEASLVERLRLPVKIVEGEYSNLKITTHEDLRIAKSFIPR